VIRALAMAILLGGALWAAETADNSKSAADNSKLLAGEMPDDAAKTLVQGKCMLCHSGDYLTQQRLNEGQWQKTVEKMRKFGSPATDDEVKQMSAYLAKYWTQELPLGKPVKAALPK
jgi:hypothetical protein